MTSEQQATGDTPPPTVRDGSRVWVDAPLDSPYAMRLRRFSAHWDFDSARWWVGVTKATALEQLLTLPLGAPVDAPEPEREHQRSQSAAAAVVEMACDDYMLGVTDTGEPYGTHCDTPHLALMLRGGKTGLRAEMARRYWDAYETPAPQQAISDACMVLEGLAAQQDSRRVHLRVAEHDGAVHIDMGDPDGHAIEISGGTWDIGVRTPVLFRRTKLTGMMPRPYADGDYSRLWDFVPVDKEDRPLVLAWLVQALIHPDTAHPVLALLAEHGCGKTSAAKCLVALVDPSSVPTRKAPRDSDGWVTAANASWVVALDNLTGEIPLWLSDSLCRAVTGEGDVRRALYTDQDVSVMSFRRALIITGVDVEVTQGDLADRLLRIELPRMAEWLGDEELAAAWADAHPDILGGLLTLAAAVHRWLASAAVTNLPRMADYARVLTAIDEMLGTEGLDRYREQARRTAADTLDSPFIAALESRRYCCEGRISAAILQDLKPSEENWKPPKDWPANARAVTAQLTRHSPALRAQGWDIEHDDGRNHRNRVQWTISPPVQPEKDCIPDSQDSQTRGHDHNRSSDGVGGRESGHAEPAGRGGDPTAFNSQTMSPTSQSRADLQLDMPLTSEDEVASHASQKYTPSLVLCNNCGDEIPKYMPLARARGYCLKPHCSDAANNDEEPF